MMTFCIENSGDGYTTTQNDKLLVIEPEESKRNSVIGEWIDGIAENCYGALYDKYKPKDVPKTNSKIDKFIKSLPTITDHEFNKSAIKYLDIMPKEEWVLYLLRVRAGEDVSTELAKKIGSTKTAKLSVELKSILPKVRRPGDASYCKALMSMVASSFSSWRECHKLHLEKTFQLEESLRKKKEGIDNVFDTLLAYANKLESIGYGLPKWRPLRDKVFKVLKEGKEVNQFFLIPCNEIKKYKSLIDTDEKTLYRAYSALKIFWGLEKRKKYISLPKKIKDYQVPFGLTGRGPRFDLKITETGQLQVKIGDDTFNCMQSHCFAKPSVIKKENSFQIEFCHKLKDKRKEVYGDSIKAIVKEIKVLKKCPKDCPCSVGKECKGSFYLYLPYTMLSDSANFDLGWFFCRADQNEYCKKQAERLKITFEEAKNRYFNSLPNSIVTVGCDLNLGTPITVSVAKIKKGNKQGSLHALDYGHGDLLSCSVLAGDTELSKKIKSLCNKMKMVTDVIRNYKKSVRNQSDLPENDLQWLETEVGNIPYGNTRHQIQIIISRYFIEERSLWQKCKENGHNNLSENIRLLELMDSSQSLHSAFNNIHINERYLVVVNDKSYAFYGRKEAIQFAKDKGGEVKDRWIPYRKLNNKRDNLRNFTSKQFGAKIAKFCISVGANICFIEDLEIDQDYDKDTNSLTRLFAAGQLTKSIKLALEKVGIACVGVPPAGTSQKDPLTGLFGYRDKTFLFVERDGNIVKIHADLAASLNILLLGLSHSIVPYKLWVKDAKVLGQDKKRLSQFLKLTKIAPPDFDGKAYCLPYKFISEEDKEKMVVKIKDIALSGKKIESIALTSSGNSIYKNFQLPEVLD